jgi:hypothetical protein
VVVAATLVGRWVRGRPVGVVGAAKRSGHAESLRERQVRAVAEAFGITVAEVEEILAGYGVPADATAAPESFDERLADLVAR